MNTKLKSDRQIEELKSISFDLLHCVNPFCIDRIELCTTLATCDTLFLFSDYSMQLNASRIKVLQAQDDIVNAMKDQAAKDLLNVSGDEDAYKQLLKDLIVQVGTLSSCYLVSDGNLCLLSYKILLLSFELLQCLLRLKEPSVLLRCREEDLGLVESILEDAKEEYAGKANVHAPEVAVDTTIFLPPPPTSSDPHGLHW